MAGSHTIGTIYNQSTIAELVPITNQWLGHFVVVPPNTISSLQSGGFEHINKGEDDVAAVVYRSNNCEIKYDWVFAWCNSSDKVLKGVYTDIVPSRSINYDDDPAYWAQVKKELNLNLQTVTVMKYGCESVALINDVLPSKFVGLMVTSTN